MKERVKNAGRSGAEVYLTKGKYGWFVPVKTKDLGGNELMQNIQVTWKKDTEPLDEELNEHGSIPCKMFIETDRERREAFLGVYQRKDGQMGLKIVILENQIKPKKKEELKIDESDLPFY